MAAGRGPGLGGAEPAARAGQGWTYGKVFKDGKLYCFDARRVLVARAWPDLRAWTRTRCLPWRPTCRVADREIMDRLFPPGEPARSLEPALPLAPLDAADQRINWSLAREHQALGGFFDAIPDEVRGEALRFPERRWQVLNLVARCQGGLELCRANPALAFALACNRAFHRPGVQRPYRAARSLLPKPQRAILDWLGFPASEPVRRILRKIDPAALSVPRMLALRQRLADPAMVKLLAHVPVIGEGVLHLVVVPRYAALLTPAFLEDLARRTGEQPWRAMLLQPLWDTEDCCRLLGQAFELPACRTLDALLAHHQMLAVGLGRAEIHRYPPLLPAPPFPGGPGLEPITTSAGLRQESLEMEHCIVSHLVRVHAGLEAVYRVTGPVRATLSLEKGRDGWRAGEVFGLRNGAVPGRLKAELFHRLLGGGDSQARPGPGPDFRRKKD